jgi:ankyrin repeat protein
MLGAPLGLAATNGRAEVVELLWSQMKEKIDCNRYMNILWWVMHKGHMECLKILLRECEVSVLQDQLHFGGLTLLQYAARDRQTEAVEIILSSVSDVEARKSWWLQELRLARIRAVSRGHDNTVKLLNEHITKMVAILD